ncbi:ribosomal-processing cysteine protease Prp [Salipaludibacillus keqinensis]|uniref:Ribosomal processing cysteine protease Prp n=1 Tax=Salipaludibacillus keqinensis TaxID=2045207 RepID=A0A323TLY4_9BACI|nr:ribosomal-processing cysteine protease Prp [Salipaludibacillus keqinensis]PYZ93613.1 ribosomal-processing cysteine protease Prp [Salipaludibacillus keqinensis]
MIQITFDRNDDGFIHTFTMSGHADSGPYGHDLVCAGASAVAFGTVNAIAEICHTELDVEMKNDGGFLRCRVPEKLHRDTDEKVQLLLNGMLVSMKTMEEQYSQFIRIES